MHFNQYKIPMNPFSLQVAECAKSDRCEYCHAPEVVFNFPFEVEQIIPIAKRGKTDLDNLALACRSTRSLFTY